MREIYTALLELQNLDQEIEGAEAAAESFAPQLESLEEPVASMAREVEAVRARLAEMKETSRRLERAASEKRERLGRYQDRLNQVRNAREEAAVRTEMDLVRRAAEADEQEAYELLEQVTRTELKLDEMEKQLAKAREDLEPKRAAVLEARQAAQDTLAQLQDRRENLAIRIETPARQLYQRVRAGRTRMVLAPLRDGACGHCYSVIPVQQQQEIQHARDLYRCEVCGVILYPES